MNKLTNVSKRMLMVLLADPAILAQVLVEEDNPKSCKINDDGSVTFGKHKHLFWSKLFRADKTISFVELAQKITEILPGIGVNKHPMIEGLKHEFVDTLFGGDKNKLIQCWLISYLVRFDGKSGTYIDKDDLPSPTISSNVIGVPMVVRNRKGERVTAVMDIETISAINAACRE